MSSFDDLVDIGGSVCLDFVNTVDRRGTARATERLRGYTELIEWAGAAVFSAAADTYVFFQRQSRERARDRSR